MKKIITVIFFAITSCVPLLGYAAVVHIVPISLTPTKNTAFTFSVELMPQSESINAVEGTIILPPGLDIVSLNDSHSIVSLWVDKPHIDQGKILFSGVIPGGYISEKGELFSVIAKASQDIVGTIDLKNIQVLKNDGQGTAAIVTLTPAHITTQASGTSVGYQLSDTIPPEHFTAIIAQDPDVYEGKWFVVFTTQDKQSGINHYEVSEDKKGLIWATTTSPYLLTDQTRKYPLRIKAVDNAGNVQIEEIKGLYTGQRFVTYGLWGILILLVLTWIFFRRHREK